MAAKSPISNALDSQNCPTLVAIVHCHYHYSNRRAREKTTLENKGLPHID